MSNSVSLTEFFCSAITKDALFLSLLKPFLDDIGAAFQDIRADYYADAGKDPMAQLKTSMQEESAAILHLIFSHYREAVLLFYGSAGSSLEHYFDMIVNNKIEERFCRHAAKKRG